VSGAALPMSCLKCVKGIEGARQLPSSDMTQTIEYYNDNAESFFQSTVNVDMSPLHAKFLQHIGDGGVILDAGCGSGRDAKAFKDTGHRVEAFDASSELAHLASRLLEQDVSTRTFLDVNEVAAYDGIWACASLLHLPQADVPIALSKLWTALKPNGVLYVSFKLGEGERSHGERHFTDVTDDRLAQWMGEQEGLFQTEIWITSDRRPGRDEQWVNGLFRKSAPSHKVITGGDDPFLPKLVQEINRAQEIDISVSFIMASGMSLLMPDLQGALKPHVESDRAPARLRVLTGDYLDVTDIQACRLLMLLKEHGADVRVFEAKQSSFHMKAYIFAQQHPCHGLSGTAFIGSSNISRQALRTGLEWNYRIEYPGDVGFLEARQRFNELFVHPQTVELTHDWIDAYDKRRLAMRRPVAPGTVEQEPPPEPTSIQKQALQALADTRSDSYRRGLVVLATGLGKTWLAAFDSQELRARKVLFVAHREEILDQAAATFLRIRPTSRVGYYASQQRDMDSEILCASIQTLGKEAHLERFAVDHFDYIVVDEFHHAAAPTYRRLLAHFKPQFLLGLTATPDRSDQSDILTLCDDNLVFSCGLFQGIEAKLLTPFHYYGIFDESVNYTEIPWRQGRFDPEALSNKLATLARARHALRKWQELKQQRTLAFCVSVRHAEFMAEQFRKAGVTAQAVYGGSSLGRADALDQLNDGRIQVLFSVDLFNEGMDLPSIDTVMMLRPTESKILFLQQLGRGLRKAEGKDKLVVLDFIGNHQSFLHKPQALCEIGSSLKQLAQFAHDAELGRLVLPEGCYVNFDLKLIDFLKGLERPGIEAEYRALKDSLGRRPTISETYRSGMSMAAMRQQFGGWFDMLARLGELSADEQSLALQHQELLREFEVTSMTKSFKMVLAEAFQELNGWQTPPALPVLAEQSWQVLQRRRTLLVDLPDHFPPQPASHGEEWVRYWRHNPVKAWVGENRERAVPTYFDLKEGRFCPKAEIPAYRIAIWSDLVQELVDYRLAAYEHRQAAAPSNNVTPFVRPATKGTELPFFPNIRIACGHFKTGHADAEEYLSIGDGHGKLDPQRHFIARASGNSMNGGKNPICDGDYLLLERVTASNAGAITGTVMAIEQQDESGDNQYLLRVVLKSPAGGYVLRANNPAYEDMTATDDMRTLARLKSVLSALELAVGRSFMREDIPALFGTSFNPGNWNVGHVVLADQRAHILLVTLNKQGKSAEHRYKDRWVDEETFQWESQNKTSPSSSKGLGLINHQENGWTVHLFVRDGKLNSGKAAPFVYFGPVNYVKHEGSEPMRFDFRLA
jgi:superfamily II DNA or RNA helicase/HKD family nuclease/SOS-response transcriptional repressor LexA/protein-L-isoaspartate O-methyltransferase